MLRGGSEVITMEEGVGANNDMSGLEPDSYQGWPYET
jgi:hypothetical protein